MRIAKLNPGMVGSAAGTTNLSKALHDGKTMVWNSLTGHTFVLPAAVGSGMRVRIVETVAPTSGSNILRVANATDTFVGSAFISLSTGVGTNFPTAATSDTLTLNRGTTGGASRGDIVDCEDVAPGLWTIQAYLNGSGALATPFTATVS